MPDDFTEDTKGVFQDRCFWPDTTPTCGELIEHPPSMPGRLTAHRDIGETVPPKGLAGPLQR